MQITFMESNLAQLSASVTAGLIMVLILLVGFVTPRGSLKTEDRRRFLEFNFSLKNKLTLNVYS